MLFNYLWLFQVTRKLLLTETELEKAESNTEAADV